MADPRIPEQAAQLVSPAEIQTRIDAAQTLTQLDDVRWLIVHLPSGMTELARRYGARRRALEAAAAVGAEAAS